MSLSLSLCLSVCLSLPLCLSLSVSLSLSLSVCLCLCLSLSVSLCLSLCLCLPLSPSLLLSIFCFVDIDRLITVSGMVIRTSSLIPEMREGDQQCKLFKLVTGNQCAVFWACVAAFFECYLCHETKVVEIDRGRIAEPSVCSHCQSLHTMTLIHNRSMFTDKQMVKLQESPGEGETREQRESFHWRTGARMNVLIKSHSYSYR